MSKKYKAHIVRNNYIKIGDIAQKKYESTGDIKIALAAIKSFDGAIRTARTQIMYKRLTGSPGKIDFLEE